jgi:hypothetical protein
MANSAYPARGRDPRRTDHQRPGPRIYIRSLALSADWLLALGADLEPVDA